MLKRQFAGALEDQRSSEVNDDETPDPLGEHQPNLVPFSERHHPNMNAT